MQAADKAALRRAIRSRFPGEDVRRAESEAMCRHILAWEPYRRAEAVGGYIPLRREADVTAVMRDALASGKTLVLPRVESEGSMTLRRVRSLEALVPGAYGIPEPDGDTEIVPLAALSLLIVPLEGIDRLGMRLGKGGGYYDRLLADTPCATLGAVMSWQWEERIPAQPWDKPLQAAADLRGIHLFEPCYPIL
ncbi:MAG: 5-formyltetrahydrofolate cyclo-ligase [Aristaeellaceae bacterium]